MCFGLYDDAGLASLRREYGDGGFVLGGCIVADQDWDWSCKACGAKFSDNGSSTAGSTGEELFLRERLQKIAAQLKADGRMPTLEQVLQVMAEVRKEYQPKILAAKAAGPKKRRK